MQSELPYAFQRRPDRSWMRMGIALLIALAAHVGIALLFLLFALLGWLRTPSDSRFAQRAPVALLDVPQSIWDDRRTIHPFSPQVKQSQPSESTLPKEQEAEKEKPKELEAMPRGQVVEVEPGNDQKPAEDSKYLAEHDNQVAKETKAKETSRFYKNAMAHATTTVPKSETTGHDPVSKAQLAGNQGTANDPSEKKASSAAAAQFEVPDIKKRDQLALAAKSPNGEIHNQTESEAMKGNSDRLRILPGSLDPGALPQPGSSGQQGDRNQLNLLPTAATVDKITGAAAPDHLDELDEGQGTYLNTREFKYATFFNRVKQRVGENWDPNEPLRQRDPENRIYAYKDRYTLLTVALDDRGRLLQVTIEKSCGVEFLDHEAIAAFERAQPFPNPPPGMIDSSGMVKFDFGFFLEVNSGSSLRLFRARD